jgi:hypothetical protein
LNLLPVSSTQSGLANPAFKAQHWRIVATRRVGKILPTTTPDRPRWIV